MCGIFLLIMLKTLLKHTFDKEHSYLKKIPPQMKHCCKCPAFLMVKNGLTTFPG